jgi:putative beta-barrel porin BBP2
MAISSPAFAQNPTVPDPDADATMRFGPLALKSTLALSNLGIDTNVFNEADADPPQSDFTMTFTPATNLWLRMGRTWISGTIHVDWVYYNKFASERSMNTNFGVGISRAFNRLSFNAGASRLSTRDRPGYEIDARSQRLETLLEGEVGMRVLAKTHIGVRTWSRKTAFDQAAVFLGTPLARELNRTSSGSALVVRHDLTPLTSLAFEAGRDYERFAFSSLRDSNSTRVAGTVKFQPLALISGDASVGYRDFTPSLGDVPPYRGAIAAVNLSYRLLGTTRLGVQMNRDVQHSFEFNQPYYLQTGISGSVQQQVYGPFDVLARIGFNRLAYRDRVGAVVPQADRMDRVRSFGAGAGYRLGTDKRLGFSVDHQSRRTGLAGRPYKGLRVGMSLTYET